jgi:iron(III) transport system substrate-binding protein
VPLSPRNLLLALTFVAVLIAVLLFMSPGKGVVVYTSVDSEYALPLFERFTAETGIKIVPRTDGESVKTTEMARRLLQLKDNPDGDVFWNSEQSHTQLLANQGVFEPYVSPQAAAIPAEYKDAQNQWTAFGCRARVFIYNTNKVKREDVPTTLEGLADPRWKGRAVVAKPIFGTTRSHLVALVTVLGEEKAFKLFRAWRENGIVIAESNGDVRNRVADGLFDLGLTDTDDVLSAMDRKKPVDFVVPEQTADWPGVFLIPNTVAVLKNCQHPKEAKLFVDFLLRPETETWLANENARQIPVRPLTVNLPDSLRNLKPAAFDAAKVAEQVLPLGDRIYKILSGEEK